VKIIVGTRGSALATTQTESVAALLRARFPRIDFAVQIIRTAGDINAAQPLAEIGGKGVFVKELELALQREEIDLAVHSLKDVPAVLGEGLALGATLRRADPRDALITRDGSSLQRLQRGAVIATGSRRREVQLRAIRPDLRVSPIRGNIDTRLRKLDAGQYDALVLAAAGLGRLAKDACITEFLDPGVMLPAVGQGVLAIECRRDSFLTPLVRQLDDPQTRLAVTAERAFLARLGAGCELPVAAYARISGLTIDVHGMIGRDDGSFERTTIGGPASRAAALGAQLADILTERLAEVPA
jgi:hydroxymethylbilane synthase